MIELIVTIIVIAILISFIGAYWYLIVSGVVIVAAAIFVSQLVRHIRKNRYFASSDFQDRKNEIKALVAEHNAIAEYA